MCDEGRYGYRSIDSEDRLKSPALREGDAFRKAAWDDAIERTAAALSDTLQKHGEGGVALLASPQMTNEELFFLRQLFRQGLNIRNIEYRVPLAEEVYSDDFLITADKNPNSRGADLLDLAGSGIEELLSKCAEGRIQFLYICHHDLMRGHDAGFAESALAKVGFVAYQGYRNHATASLAHVQLASTVYAEKEGTFTNCENRVQRIHAAVPPLDKSLPDLELLARLGKALNISLPNPQAEEVFGALAHNVEAFSGMSHQSIGASGQLLK
jgi:predicted molibdopterin-dependent oxidoreductase YjgC